MKDVQSIILKQNTDEGKKRRGLVVRKKKARRMSAYRITSGIIISLVFAFISFAGLVGLCVYSAVNKGNATIIIGIIGLILFFLSLAGLIIAILERKNDEAKQKFSIIGILVNILLSIIFCVLYIVGNI